MVRCFIRMEKVISRLNEGDKKAFDELFHAFWDAGLRFVQSFLPPGTSGDDIVQDVFVQLWDKRKIFEDERHFKAYYYKALRNNTIKFLTRQKPSEELAAAQGLKSDDFFRTIVEVEFQREVMQAIDKLPEKRREVILLSMAGLTVKEIADNLGISINTVKIHKKKAYSTLRDELKDSHLKALSLLILGLSQ